MCWYWDLVIVHNHFHLGKSLVIFLIYNLRNNLLTRSDPLSTLLQFKILTFLIFTIFDKLDAFTYVGNLANVNSILMNKYQ